MAKTAKSPKKAAPQAAKPRKAKKMATAKTTGTGSPGNTDTNGVTDTPASLKNAGSHGGTPAGNDHVQGEPVPRGTGKALFGDPSKDTKAEDTDAALGERGDEAPGGSRQIFVYSSGGNASGKADAMRLERHGDGMVTVFVGPERDTRSIVLPASQLPILATALTQPHKTVSEI